MEAERKTQVGLEEKSSVSPYGVQLPLSEFSSKNFLLLLSPISSFRSDIRNFLLLVLLLLLFQAALYRIRLYKWAGLGLFACKLKT